MKIAIISKFWENTSPNSTGGTGSSVGNLVNELVKQGHNVTLFATKMSRTNAQKLVAFKNKPYNEDYSEIMEYVTIAEAFDPKYKFDLIHAHVEHKSLFFGNLTKTPTLHTIRYGEFFDQETALLKKHKKQFFAANSKALITKYPYLNYLGYSYNGLDLTKFPFNDQPKPYLFFLGRISPQKGAIDAIKIAKKAKMPIYLAGKMVEADQAFIKQIKQEFKKKGITYLGELNFKEKIKYLKNAYCLLQPTDTKNFFEACSNTILESMAVGTPVITTNSGSNKELVQHGKTGFIINSVDQAVKAVKKAKDLKREDCRKRIEKYFTIEKMTNGYLKIYKKLINKAK